MLFYFIRLNLHLVKGKQLRLPKNLVYRVIYFLNERLIYIEHVMQTNFPKVSGTHRIRI